MEAIFIVGIVFTILGILAGGGKAAKRSHIVRYTSNGVLDNGDRSKARYHR